MPERIFISYREADSKAWAILLGQELVAAFGSDSVFLDKDGLHAGRWNDQLEAAIGQSKVMVVLIGRQWLTVKNKRGDLRLFEPDDVHRREIAQAISRSDMTVIPICVDGASMPTPEALPEDIRALDQQQARSLDDDVARRRATLASLIADIEAVTGLRARKVNNGGAAAWIRTGVIAIVAAPLIGLAVVVGAEAFLAVNLSPGEGRLITLAVFGVTAFLARPKRASRKKHAPG